MDLRRLLITAVLLTTTGASAQLLSPGKLARPHASLEGLSNCLKCHESGNKFSNERCLGCHTAVGSRAAARRGFHGQAAVRTQSCASCHREHRGVERELIDWGKGGRDGFEHGRVGWPLSGAHGKAKCLDCHESRRVVDKDARPLFKMRKPSYLGLATTCATCHFDEHRGQTRATKRGCQACHSTTKWEDAPGFRHNRDAKFRLTGRHTRVACKRCHAETLVDNRAGAFPAPKKPEYTRYDDISHDRCTDCHRDAHKGERGVRCERCHSTKGWPIVNDSAKDFGFHDKTKFPLRGAHVEVACKSCHGPFRGERKPAYKDLPFAKCGDCHMDAHVGQLDEGVDCDRCHSVQAFTPTTFFLEQHAEARFPLEGAHRAVACRECHTDDKSLRRKVPNKVERDLARQGRSVQVALLQLKLPKVEGRCADCHRDTHDGQFAHREEGCAACHQPKSFVEIKFDHNVDSRFALEGKHSEVKCDACHTPAKLVRYRPLEQTCSACHLDAHLGQFDKEPARACQTCHSTSAFSPSTVDHDKTAFPLRGKHARVECVACHPMVDVEGDKRASWYRGVPLDCGGCHADQHRGRFQEYTP